MTEQIYRLNDQIAELELDIEVSKSYYHEIRSTYPDEASIVAVQLAAWMNEKITLEQRRDDLAYDLRDDLAAELGD